MSFSEKKIGGKLIYKGKILDLTLDDIVMPDGREAKREIVRHSGGAAVLFVREGCVLLVKQFRYAYGKEMYEIPAGMISVGEAPAAAAARELEEETGYMADLKHLADIYPSPGYTDEVIHIYTAESSSYIGEHPDDGEFLNAEFIPLEKVEKMIENGEINDAKTVAAIYKYLYKNKISL